jgi:DNA-binding NarL/FixJ family response regulator
MSNDQIAVIIVEDNDTFRQGLKVLIESNSRFKVLKEAAGFYDLVNQPVIEKADIILMDLAMPEVNGFEAAKEILWAHPKTPILAVTMHQDKAYLLELIRAGFKGCVFKSNIYAEIFDAIDAVLLGKLHFPPGITIAKNDK